MIWLCEGVCITDARQHQRKTHGTTSLFFDSIERPYECTESGHYELGGRRKGAFSMPSEVQQQQQHSEGVASKRSHYVLPKFNTAALQNHMLQRAPAPPPKGEGTVHRRRRRWTTQVLGWLV